MSVKKRVGKRGTSWVARAYIDGENRHLGTFTTQREAKAAESAVTTAQRRRGTGSETVGEFAERWLVECVYPAKRESTQRTYRHALKRFVDEFGEQRLADLTRDEMRAWAQSAPDGARAVSCSLLHEAVERGLIDRNPLANLKIKRQPRVAPQILSVSQVRTLAAAAYETLDEPMATTVAAMILWQAGTGMRPGEVFALRHDQVHVDRQEVEVISSRDVRGVETLPKNGKARTVVMLDLALEAYAAIPRRIDTPYVFTTEDGRPFTKGIFNYWFTQTRSAAGLPRFRQAWLRHTCATRLLEQHPAYVVAIQLGHEDGGRLVETTYGRPSHADALARIKQTVSAVTDISEVKRNQDKGDAA